MESKPFSNCRSSSDASSDAFGVPSVATEGQKETNAMSNCLSSFAEASDADASPQTSLRKATDDLRSFMKSPTGQELVCRTYECYKFLASLADCSRKRDVNGHTVIRIVASSASAAAGIVILGATITGTAGLAAPAVAAGAIAGALSASAIAGVAQMANVLASLGLESLEAQLVASRIAELREKMAEWDARLGTLVQAVAKAAERPDEVHVAEAVVDTGMTGYEVFGAVYGILYARASLQVAEGLSRAGAGQELQIFQALAAPQMAQGAIESGSVVAQTLMCTSSGVTCVCGLIAALQGLQDLKNSQSSAADDLDAHADRFCVIMHMMLGAARHTPAYYEIVGQVPQVVCVEIQSCTLPRANCRLGNSTSAAYKKVTQKVGMLGEFVADKIGRFRGESLNKESPHAEKDDPGEVIEREDGLDGESEHESKDESEDESEDEPEDPSRSSPLKPIEPKSYFSVALPPRTRSTIHDLCYIPRDQATVVNKQLSLRRFVGQDQLIIGAHKRCGVKGAIFGDRTRGDTVFVQIRSDRESIEAVSESGTSKFRISYELLGGGDTSREEENHFLDLAKRWEWDAVMSELDRNPGLVNVQPRGAGDDARKRWSALHHAAESGNADVVSALLRLGAAPDALTEEADGQCLTPLQVAHGDAVKQIFHEANTRALAVVEADVQKYRLDGQL